jgi:glucan phosphorylase
MWVCRRLRAESEERKEDLCNETVALLLLVALVREQFDFRPRELICWSTYTFTLHTIAVPIALHECQSLDDGNKWVGRLEFV